MMPPAEWPPNVRPIPTEGVSLFGIDPATNQLYWDASKLFYAILSSPWEAWNKFRQLFRQRGLVTARDARAAAGDADDWVLATIN
jgi:hypothetical protein